MLRLADDLALPLDAVTQTFGVLAVRNAGKSNLAAVLAEQMHAASLPFVVIDPTGTWWGLRSASDGRGAGLPVPIFGGRRGDIPLERTAGADVAELIVEKRLSCVLDLCEFSEGDKIRFLIDFAERLYRRNEAPLHLFLEESDDYIPQRPFREQARLLRAWENIVRRGRARGLGMTMITQRSAAINKSVLTQVETLFVLRTTSPNDRKAVQGWIDYHGENRDVLASLPGLANGEAWVWSPNWLHTFRRVKIHRRRTFDSAATPKQQAGKQRTPATLADIDLTELQARFAATVERAKADDPRELRRQIDALRRELAAAKQAAPVPEVRAVEVPVLTEDDRVMLRGAARQAEAYRSQLEAILQSLRFDGALVERIVARVDSLVAAPRPVITACPVPRRPETRTAVARMAQVAATARRTNGAASQLPIGEHRVLTACAQYPEGCTREQLSVLTGYKRSSRDAYVQRLRERGLVIDAGGRVLATVTGVAALGPDFAPLPTGDELQAYWLERLPVGERRILEALLTAYPQSLDRAVLDDATGYQRSSRDAYLQRLGARQLVTVTGRGEVRASEVLFDG